MTTKDYWTAWSWYWWCWHDGWSPTSWHEERESEECARHHIHCLELSAYQVSTTTIESASYWKPTAAYPMTRVISVCVCVCHCGCGCCCHRLVLRHCEVKSEATSTVRHRQPRPMCHRVQLHRLPWCAIGGNGTKAREPTTGGRGRNKQQMTGSDGDKRSTTATDRERERRPRSAFTWSICLIRVSVNAWTNRCSITNPLFHAWLREGESACVGIDDGTRNCPATLVAEITELILF
jgi:hypothetical protein